MAAEALLDANLRLAETPEFELSDTDRLGLFVVSRLAQRQNVRVSLQPSPYGGTTAVVFVPDALLSDDVPDTNGMGFRLDRALPSKKDGDEGRTAALSQVPVTLPGRTASMLDGPVELEAPVDLDALDDFPDSLDQDGERGGIFRPRRSIAGVPGDQQQVRQDPRDPSHADGDTDEPSGEPVRLPRRRAPKLVSSHGRPVTQTKTRRDETTDRDADEVTELPQAARESSERPGVLEDLPKRSRSVRRGPSRRESGDSSGSRRGSADDWPGATDSADGAAERRQALGRGGGPSGPAGPGEALTRGPEAVEGRRDADAPALPQRASRRGAESGGTHPGAPAGGGTRPGAAAGGGTGALPRRVRQANLAPQLKDGPDRRAAQDAARAADPTERDADEVRNRMASLQRGWRRGREENAEGDEAQDGTAPGTTKGDGR